MAKKKNVVLDEPQEDVPENDPLKLCRDRFKEAQEYWSDDYDDALDDIKFRAGEQWPTAYVTQREIDKRPCLVVDKLNQYVRQIVNDGRQNRPSIKVRPVDSGSDIQTSEVFQGIIKHIEDRSGADMAYDTAIDNAATCGYGYFKVINEYAKDDGFEQELCIKRVRNPLSIYIDPDAKEADGSDMKYAFEVEEMKKDDFKAKYPGKIPEDFKVDSETSDWYEGDKVRLARYWYVEETERTLYQLQDGTVVEEEEFNELKDAGLSLEDRVVASRKIPKHTVWHALVSGKEYLEEPQEWIGKYIPILVVYGNELDIEGKATHFGIIRQAKDAQRLYNYSRSAFAERVALSPKAPWVAAEGQVENYSEEWETANVKNHSVLRYTPISVAGKIVGAPQRQPAADIPSGFAQDMQISEHDIEASVGMYRASLGAPSNERSGKAILARQKEGDTGTFHYHDNLNRAIRHCGRILVDLIPKIYDTYRVVRILGYDGTPDQVQIDPSIPTASQKNGTSNIYNLGVGTYDVTITTGPSYNTLRMEAAESMMQLIQAHPDLMSVIGDVFVKNMDWPGAEEISERLKIMLPPQIQEAEQARKQGGMPPEMQAMIQGFEQAMQEKDMQLQQIIGETEKAMQELAALKVQAKSKETENAIKEREAGIKEFEAETERMKVEMENGIEKVQMLLSQHEAHVKELVSAFQAAQAPAPDQDMEADQQPDANAAMNSEMIAMIQASHDQTMQAIAQVAEAMMRPKTMQIQSPSGAVYTGQVQ